MDIQELDYQEDENKRKGMIGSGLFHALFFMLLLFSFIKLPNPPPGQEGVLVSFGIPDAAQGDPNPNLLAMADTEPEASEPEETEPEEVEPEASEPAEAEPEPDPTPTKKSVTKKQPKVLETDDPKALALKKAEADKKKKEKEKKAAAKKKADAKKKAAKEKKEAEDKEAKKKATKEAADKKAAAEAEAAAAAKTAAAKKKFGDLFGDGDTPGTSGTPTGDPTSSNLDGISSGTGKIGGGLGNRGGKGPALNDNSQATGIVVVKVCVDSNGKVVSAKYTQSGSSTTDSKLIALAQKNAKQYSFKKGSADKQCGTITYDFKVK